MCNAFLEVLQMDDESSLQRHGAWTEKTSVQQVILMADGATFPVVASVQQWLLSCASTPVIVHAAGQLPAFVGPDTAILGISYSSQPGSSDTITQLCVAARQKRAQVHHITMYDDEDNYDATDPQLTISLHEAVPWQMQTIRLWWWVAAALQQLGVIADDLVQEISAARQVAAAFTERCCHTCHCKRISQNKLPCTATVRRVRFMWRQNWPHWRRSGSRLGN